MRRQFIPGWMAVTYDGGRHIHVLPLADLVWHDRNDDGDCPCGPTTVPIERPDETLAWMFTHHSLDGRELTEPHPRNEGAPPCP